MQNRIVLVSDDSDFFEYINSKLKIRKQDELYRYGYEALSDKLPLISSAVVIIDSENQPEQCLESLKQMPILISHTTSKEMWYQCNAGLERCDPLGTIFGARREVDM